MQLSPSPRVDELWHAFILDTLVYQEACEAMLGDGGHATGGAYAGAKEAIRGISKVAALEWGRDNIRVNVVCPFAESDGIRAWREMAPDAYERSLRGVPMGRLGDVSADIGPAVAFLLSDEASFVTAQTILIDGGAAGFR